MTVIVSYPRLAVVWRLHFYHSLGILKAVANDAELSTLFSGEEGKGKEIYFSVHEEKLKTLHFK